MPYEYRIDTMREEVKSEARDELRALQEEEDQLPDRARGDGDSNSDQVENADTTELPF